MRRARDLADFLAAPRESFLQGEAFAFYNLGTVCGWRVWGRPARDEARQLVQCIATAYAPGAPPYWSLVDLRALEAVDSAGFDVLLEFVASIRARMGTQLIRQAVVRPSGLLGALSSGFYVMLQPRHRVKVFETLAQAARWLAPKDTRALAQLVAAYETQQPTERTLAGPLRAWLGAHLERPTPEAAAKALAMSVRTMQRKLQAEATTFHAEVRHARIEAVQRLLIDSPHKVAAIALEAGFVSSQQLATSFKEVTGMTPTEFRARFRGKVARSQT